jgi:hypothetical protein
VGFQGLVQVVHISLMMFAVVNRHRFGIDVRFESVVGIGQLGQLMCHLLVLLLVDCWEAQILSLPRRVGPSAWVVSRRDDRSRVASHRSGFAEVVDFGWFFGLAAVLDAVVPDRRVDTKRGRPAEFQAAPVFTKSRGVVTGVSQ